MANDDLFTSAWIPPIVSYCLASILMTVTNKVVLSAYAFKMAFLVLAAQSIVSLLMLETFGLLGYVRFRRCDLKGSKTWLPVSFLMAIMLYTGGKSMEYLNIGIFTVFKNLTIVIIAYAEKLTNGAVVTSMMLVSFSLMILSSLVAAGTDVQFNPWGYFWVTLNSFSSACFVLYMRKTIQKMNFKDFDTVYFNNFLTAPMFLIMTFMVEDWKKFNSDQYAELTAPFLKAVLLSGISGFFISYASSWCMRVVNSTTYSMVGALNKLPISIAGLLLFGDPATFGSISSILLGFAAGMVYTKAKMNADNAKKQFKDRAHILPTPIPTTSTTSMTESFTAMNKV